MSGLEWHVLGKPTVDATVENGSPSAHYWLEGDSIGSVKAKTMTSKNLAVKSMPGMTETGPSVARFSDTSALGMHGSGLRIKNRTGGGS